MTLTRTEIAKSICKQCGYPKERASELIEATLEIIMKALESGEDVLFSGFGKFYVRKKNLRRGRDPQTGDDLILGARRVVRFKCSPLLKNKLKE